MQVLHKLHRILFLQLRRLSGAVRRVVINEDPSAMADADADADRAHDKSNLPSATSNGGTWGNSTRPLHRDAVAKGHDASATSLTTSVTVHAEAKQPSPPAPQYCALSPARRRFILSLVTLAGMVGPLSGAIYLPVLPLLEREFNVGSTSINATVSVFMVTFAIAVRRRAILSPRTNCEMLKPF